MVVDRDTFPSETVSTHSIFPNTLARLDQLGVLETLQAAPEVPMLGFRIVALGHDIARDFTPIEGFDKAAAPRRAALDEAIVDTALAAGVEGRFGQRVVDLIGAGTEDDPVNGVVLESGERVRAKMGLRRRWTRADGSGEHLVYRSPGASFSDFGPDWSPKPG